MRYTITIIMFVLLSSISPAMADGEVAYVDLQRALLETNEGKRAKSELEKMKLARQKQLDERQKQLKALQQSLESQRAFMKEDVLRKKEAEFGQQLRELQMTYASLQKELAAEEGKLTNKLLARMLKIVEKIGPVSYTHLTLPTIYSV